jgi:ABC-type transport system involved in cytochrome c biogenesis permease subunit
MGAFLANMAAGFGSGTALGTSTALFDLTAIVFLLSTIGYVVHLGGRSAWAWRFGFGLAIVGAVAQTAALILRWIAAGWDHPPFTNLYESLVFFGWGIVVVYLVIEAAYRVKVAGALVVPIAFLAMGIASVSPDKGIEPLMPALQDIWLHLHVFSASIGYAAFLVAFGFAVLYLLKDRLPLQYFGIASAALTLFSAIAVTRGGVLLARYTMNRVHLEHGMLEKVNVPGSDRVAQVVIPGAGPLLAAACAVLIVATILFALAPANAPSPQALRRGFSAFFGGTFLLVLFVVHVFVRASRMSEVSARADVYGLALMVLAAFFGVLVLIFYVRYDDLLAALPDPARLDKLGYRAVMVAFPIMTFVIVSGAVWANKAWGRYWGWDPKETASLVTWGIYLLYLHARITARWTGRRTAMISIIGFFSVLFTYLGVNLVLSGLHSYASGG